MGPPALPPQRRWSSKYCPLSAADGLLTESRPTTRLIRLRHRNGETILGRISAAASSENGGSHRYIDGMIEDITEHVEIRHALDDSGSVAAQAGHSVEIGQGVATAGAGGGVHLSGGEDGGHGAGHVLTEVRNGNEAVELYESFKPDLIFMDISMPEMDGKDAARAIRTIEQTKGGHVPIVALTAHAMDGDGTSILASGIDKYLTKPLRKTAITEALLAHSPPDALPVLTSQSSELV